MRTIECHEEQIHLCGAIQDFGYLFVFDQDQCIAASENCTEITHLDSQEVLGMAVETILHIIAPQLGLDQNTIEAQISGRIFYRMVERITIGQKDFHLSIYRYNSKMYLEIEACNVEQIKTTKLYYYAKYLEDQSVHSTWQSLTHLIREIIGFDRVMVYQFLEDRSGKVVAESKSEHIESLLGYRYPEFDIPAQARELYKVFHARHTADVDGAVFPVLGKSPEDIDLSRCSIRALSPVHLQYLRNSKVKASASFSIIVEGELWGLVACQNHDARHVDLSQRHLCVFLTQYAVNYYLAEFQKEQLAFQSVMGIMERDLKSELLINRDKYGALEKYALQIMNIMAADGILIKHDQGLKAYGEFPEAEELAKIDHFISNSGYDAVFATNEYQHENKNSLQQLRSSFPGIIRMDIMPANNWYIYVFRKERIVEETWAGKPEKIYQYDEEKNAAVASPRTSFDAWIQTTKGKSEAWKNSELSFMRDIAQIIQHSIAQRGGEIEDLNKELIRSNNALDTFGYTLTHDLKNPLTSIQLSAQMLLYKKDASDELKNKLLENIVDGTKLINEMMDKVYKMSQVNNVEFDFELIDPLPKIISIVESSKYQYNVPDLKFNVGLCLPILGERTLVYQLFLNLIGNAIKYSSKTPSPVVEVYSTRQDSSICYFIKDNGIGMDLKDNPNIFEIFKRMPNTQGFDGSGIGLSIVKRIADKLKAVISVESELNAGTTFTIEFPDTR